MCMDGPAHGASGAVLCGVALRRRRRGGFQRRRRGRKRRRGARRAGRELVELRHRRRMGGGGARWLVENGGCFHEHLGVVESIGEESELIVLFVWGFIPVTGSFIRLLDYIT